MFPSSSFASSFSSCSIILFNFISPSLLLLHIIVLFVNFSFVLCYRQKCWKADFRTLTPWMTKAALPKCAAQNEKLIVPKHLEIAERWPTLFVSEGGDILTPIRQSGSLWTPQLEHGQMGRVWMRGRWPPSIEMIYKSNDFVVWGKVICNLGLIYFLCQLQILLKNCINNNENNSNNNNNNKVCNLLTNPNSNYHPQLPCLTYHCCNSKCFNGM